MNRVVFMTQSMSGGGCERVISELANWFVSQNIKCSILTESNKEVFYNLDDKIDVIPLSEKKSVKSLDIFNIYKNMRKEVKRLNPDILISMPEKVNVWTTLFMLGSNIPLIVSERNDPRIYPYNKIKRVLRKLLYPIRCNGLVFQTIEAQNYFSDAVKSKSRIIANPINIERIMGKLSGEKTKTIIAAGRLEKQKNHKLLIESFNEFNKTYPEYKLIIYGEGSERKNMVNLLNNISNNNILLPGKVENIFEVISSAEIFVLSSDYEGVPNVLIEALALAMPVISTDCPPGGPRSLIDNKINGILVPVNDKSQMLNALLELASDKALRDKLSREATAVREIYDIKNVGPKWLEFIHEVLQ